MKLNASKMNSIQGMGQNWLPQLRVASTSARKQIFEVNVEFSKIDSCGSIRSISDWK